MSTIMYIDGLAGNIYPSFWSLGEQNFFTSAMIKDCMKKVIAVNLHQVVQVRE